MNAEKKPKRLGEILIDEGVITEDQLNIALTEQKKVHEPLGKLLVNVLQANLAVSLEHISQPSSAITYYRRALENFTNGLATFNPDVVNQRLELLGKP